MFTLDFGGSTSVLIFTPAAFCTSVEVLEDPTSFFIVLPKESTLVGYTNICTIKNYKENFLRFWYLDLR
jgi:hypothetical protein